ncbi:MAG: hypothetical protein V4727_05640 [Verrucomicrobiota bacterium]
MNKVLKIRSSGSPIIVIIDWFVKHVVRCKTISLVAFMILSATPLHAEDTKYVIKEGELVSELTNSLDTYGYSHGNHHGLQWLPKEGEDFLFCKLSDKQALVVSFDIKTNKVKSLSVVIDQTQRKEYPVVYPSSIVISAKSFALEFKK